MTVRLNEVIPWLLYPLTLATVFLLFAGLSAQDLPLAVATYLPIVLAAGWITLLEIRYPHHDQWRPDAAEIRIDLLFMTVVQLAFPPVVGFLFAYLLIEPVRALDLSVAAWWPHAWPLWAQVLLMILAVDFLRYWLHRFAHENKYLWRLHAVHHSVERLYWLNTARFHPLEKALQMALDSLPFLLMGVAEPVLASYYIAYATNGFFQHSNIRLRFGVLNYIVGSAELHRWHHSREPGESNANYGNNVIVWDLVFGTWFLPRDRQLQDVGLLDRDYPKSFLGMLRAPFRSPAGS